MMNKTICLKISEDQFKYLSKKAHQLSIEKSENFTFSDLVRDAIDKVHPESVKFKDKK